MQFISVQYLRAVAALMVVLFHVSVQIDRMGYSGSWPSGLAGGVDIFFVISGFIMWVTTYDRAKGPLDFYRRRIVRIVPLYWVLSSTILIVVLLKPSLLQSVRFDLMHVITSYLFIPSINPSTGTMEPLLVPGWTLNYEMFFYLIFGLTLLAPRSWRLIMAIIPLIALVATGFIARQHLTVLSFYGSSLLLEFAMGLILGSMLTSGLTLPAPIGWTLIVLGISGYAMEMNVGDGPSRVLVWGLPAASLICGAVFVEKNHKIVNFNGMLLLGDASYSIYLSHGIVLSALGQVWKRMSPEKQISASGILLFSIASIVVASFCGVLIYYFVEKPLLLLLGKKKPAAMPIATPYR